ncbi:type IV conjugative transfer system pilin TraA [Vibrio europaeus]|jgi:type IV conjugative transfer system pilin TraA|uniref:Pilin n=2 Tax=Vibrio oreintalis group TaxID=1891919 RepID=A0A178J3Z6_9VIBR|nr:MULTISPECIES: type IV conjugative transfer system pilin TraA [Vibrio]KLN64607.1 conjugal transfer protein TraA [Vibrio sp. VPAP30]MCG9583749.1 type IV conjugative transfer system pilin TraA [Vibrio tubiashii]MCG9617327.1 type IV conjugative transfer system pilin TraA [Vibrio tubiashii]MCG9685779.1 type IV conjugative transfer system pilin TraA [Vibrio tubiashii]MDC5706643.1 type IV conjugative transfer system pilin TraA [Vibrio europaeus]
MTSQHIGYTFVLFIGFAMLITYPVLAADLFATGKSIIKDTAGKGSTVETAMLGTGLIVSAITGLTTRNWLAAVGGFIGGNILWSVGAPMVGLA